MFSGSLMNESVCMDLTLLVFCSYMGRPRYSGTQCGFDIQTQFIFIRKNFLLKQMWIHCKTFRKYSQKGKKRPVSVIYHFEMTTINTFESLLCRHKQRYTFHLWVHNIQTANGIYLLTFSTICYDHLFMLIFFFNAYFNDYKGFYIS